jgi:hypothetical protein
LVGNYENKGRQWRKKGEAPRVNGHDFQGPEVPRAYPYGVYDSLIARTTTAKGLKVTCRLDRTHYATGTQVSREEMAAVHITPSTFHGEWNYTIHPAKKRSY